MSLNSSGTGSPPNPQIGNTPLCSGSNWEGEVIDVLALLEEPTCSRGSLSCPSEYSELLELRFVSTLILGTSTGARDLGE
jgi:hypothetical protein